MKKTFLIIAAVLWQLSAAQANDYHVNATTGSNTPSNGTQAKPWKTILSQINGEFVSEQTANAQGVPENFVLEQNFPNPFALRATYSLQTAIRFGLPQPSVLTIKIFDLAGHEVATLLDRVELPAGRH